MFTQNKGELKAGKQLNSLSKKTTEFQPVANKKLREQGLLQLKNRRASTDHYR